MIAEELTGLKEFLGKLCGLIEKLVPSAKSPRAVLVGGESPGFSAANKELMARNIELRQEIDRLTEELREHRKINNVRERGVSLHEAIKHIAKLEMKHKAATEHISELKKDVAKLLKDNTQLRNHNAEQQAKIEQNNRDIAMGTPWVWMPKTDLEVRAVFRRKSP